MDRADIEKWIFSPDGREVFFAQMRRQDDHAIWVGEVSHAGKSPTWAVGQRRFSPARLLRKWEGGVTDDGMHLIRTCDVERCIRHVTAAPNHSALRTHCPEGHELVPGNLVSSVTTERRCLACHRRHSREAVARYRARQKEAARQSAGV